MVFSTLTVCGSSKGAGKTEAADNAAMWYL